MVNTHLKTFECLLLLSFFKGVQNKCEVIGGGFFTLEVLVLDPTYQPKFIIIIISIFW